MQALKNCEVPVEKLRRICRETEVSTKGVEFDIPVEIIGQERVKKALDFALSLGNDFHVAVVTKKIHPEAIRDYIEKRVEQKQAAGESFPLQDYCYAYNFKRPENPVYLTFTPGEGKIFRLMVERIRKRLEKEIPSALSEENVKKAEENIRTEANQKWNEELEKFYGEKVQQGWLEKWKKNGWTFALNETISYYPISPWGMKIELDKSYLEIQKLYVQGFKVVERDIRKINEFLDRVAKKLIEEEEKKIKELEKIICEEVIDLVFEKPLEYYSNHPKAKKFLEDLKDYTKENSSTFIPPPPQKIIGPMGPMEIQNARGGNSFVPFGINLLVDNKDVDQPPILVGSFSTYSELFGKIEKRLMGLNLEIESDLTMIKPGLFHHANGGFVILDLNEILMIKPAVFLGLNRALKEKALRIRDYSDEIGVSLGGKAIFPEPIPLNLKVIAVVSPETYYALWRYPFYKEFIETFKVKAEFNHDIEYNPINVGAYARFIKDYSRKENFLLPTSGASAKIMEFLLRENGSQERFIWDSEKLRTLLREANFYAVEEKKQSIGKKHVERAIEERIYRSNLFHEIMKRHIEEGIKLIDTEGEKIGQINGLVVYHLDDFEFGVPSRITVTTSKGVRGLINIEKEANLSGKILTKSTEIVKGFFQERYGQDKLLNFDGKICFEQSYGGIEGDSASVAELVALISSLAQVTIKQNLAVTGSINQKGEVQPIGAVNEKIEGFFDVCKEVRKEKGFAPKQGVVIPARNLKNLMLKEEVVEAVKDGKFHVFAIENVDQAIEILTGRSAEEINKMVNKRLKGWPTTKKKRDLFKLFKR